jgi:hypothetical protein
MFSILALSISTLLWTSERCFFFWFPVDDELTGDVMDVDMGADDADAALDREEPEE